MSGGERKRSYRNFLLDRRFQVKYATLIALTGGLIFGAMATLFFDKVQENSDLAAIDTPAEVTGPAAPTTGFKIDRQPLTGSEPSAPASDATFDSALREELEAEDTPVLVTLMLFCLALIFCLFLIGILVTHRIVGPIYVVDQYVRRITAGLPVRPRALRRGDEFQSLFLRVNDMARRLRDDRQADVTALERSLRGVEQLVKTLQDGDETQVALAEQLLADAGPLRDVIAEKRRYLVETDPDQSDG